MLKRYPREFREGDVAVGRDRDSGVPLRRIAADFGVGAACLRNWMREAVARPVESLV